MTIKEAIQYIKSLLSAYICSGIKHEHNPDYRMVWLSKQDIIALTLAIKALEEQDVSKSNNTNNV